jgi:DMATS type aromatic prenyltransferase
MPSLSLSARSRKKTFADAATQTLRDLWSAVHRGSCPEEVRSLLSAMLTPWGSAPVTSSPSWPSDIGSDHSPFEFSVALTPGAPEIRLVVEAQGTRPTFSATADAGLRLNDAMARRGADLRRFNRVRSLFLPEARNARFALWHAVALTTGPLRVKAYLNPQIRGVGQAARVVKQALDKLDMSAAWSTIASAAPARALRGEEIKYVALDLEESEAARVKVYLYIRDITAEELERLAALRPQYVRGEVTEFCRAITGTTGPYDSHPPCIYLAFTGNDPVPSAVTVQIPICYYVRNDRIARDRIRAYLRLRGVDSGVYDRALEAVATRPLNAKSGLHTYVSLRTGASPPRVTTYFAAELYGVHAGSKGVPQRAVRREDAVHAVRVASDEN